MSNVNILRTKNFKYIGEIFANQRHGFGITEYINGNLYLGQYVQGKRHGIGKFTTFNGVIYQGEFVNGKLNGFMECIDRKTYKQGFAKANFVFGEIIISNIENRMEGKSINIIGIGSIQNPNLKYFLRKKKHYPTEILCWDFNFYLPF